MCIEVPGEGDSTCRSNGPARIASLSKGLQLCYRQSRPSRKDQEYGGGGRPHKAVTFLVQGDKRVPGVERTKNAKSFASIQWWEAAKRSKVEEGREEEEAEEGRRMENELMNAILAGEPRETRSRGWGYSEGCACSPKALRHVGCFQLV